jgi:hypothetical protein
MNNPATEKKYVVPKETKHDAKAHKLADFVMREDDRVIRWKKIHDLLRKNNKKARKEQDKIAKECAEFRKEGLVRKDKTEVMGLRWGVSMPPITWQALVTADELAFGHSDLHHPDKEDDLDLKGSNQIVKDLEKAFPQYRVS